ncbi:MAG: glycosyltransferase family 2 protein [Saprospiraceae bacterium]|nr:glycosyltransferase family 2 protein [Saprospiraceae bacterium]
MSSKPRISLIICTYNREKFLGHALQSLTTQTLAPEAFEILIINNNSTDSTPEISQDFIAANPKLNVRYFVESNQGLSYARNRGIKEAMAPIITYIDDDAEAEADFLEKVLSYFEKRPQTAGIGGRILPKYEGSPPPWMNKYLYGFVTKVDFGDQVFTYTGKNYPAGCNMTYRKDLLEQVGGFNENLKWRADDKYIFFAIKEVSNQVFHYPEAVVQHNIDAYRTTDENFLRLSRKFGSEERIRVKDVGPWSFFKKVFEFLFKLGASVVLTVMFAVKGEWIKGKYTMLYRWNALLGLLSAK